MKIISVVGTRPNFMKVAPLYKAFQEYPSITFKVIHTGQHYDEKMSSIFFDQLRLPKPSYYLGIGSGSHAVVTAKIMMEFEKIVLQEKPDLVLVVGDVNSTLACALVTKKLNIKLAHVEAGLRSGDRNMPEEINRILTDSISDYLFVTEQSGMIHLAREGVAEEKIFFTGNVMIDSLCHYREESKKISLIPNLGLKTKEYVLMTMHRPSNVDKASKLEVVIDIINRISQVKKVVFPLHPRTLKQLKTFHLLEQLTDNSNLIILEPQGYLEFLHLMDNSAAIVTDSGGIQEESTFLKIPCLTIRTTTERPVTITLGTNVLIPELDADIIVNQLMKSLEEREISCVIPPFWDGKAANRIAELIHEELKNTVSKNAVKSPVLNA